MQGKCQWHAIIFKFCWKTMEADGTSKTNENWALYLDSQTSFVFHQYWTYCSQPINNSNLRLVRKLCQPSIWLGSSSKPEPHPTPKKQRRIKEKERKKKKKTDAKRRKGNKLCILVQVRLKAQVKASKNWTVNSNVEHFYNKLYSTLYN